MKTDVVRRFFPICCFFSPVSKTNHVVDAWHVAPTVGPTDRVLHLGWSSVAHRKPSDRREPAGKWYPVLCADYKPLFYTKSYVTWICPTEQNSSTLRVLSIESRGEVDWGSSKWIVLDGVTGLALSAVRIRSMLFQSPSSSSHSNNALEVLFVDTRLKEQETGVSQYSRDSLCKGDPHSYSSYNVDYSTSNYNIMYL